MMKVFFSVLGALLVAGIAWIALLAFGVHEENRPGYQAAYRIAYVKARLNGESDYLAGWHAALIAEHAIEQADQKREAKPLRKHKPKPQQSQEDGS
jgi:hypothetical protein